MKQVPRDRSPIILKYNTLATYELNCKLFGYNKLDVIMSRIMRPHGKNSDKYMTHYTMIRIIYNGQGLPIDHLSTTLNKSIRARNEGISKEDSSIPFPKELYKTMAEFDYGKCYLKILSKDNIDDILGRIQGAIDHWEYILGLSQFDTQYLGVIEKDGKQYYGIKEITSLGWQTRLIDIDNLETVKVAFEELKGK